MTQSLCRHLDQQRFATFKRSPVAARAGFREDRTRCGLRNHHQLPGAAGGVVAVACGVGRGHMEISGSMTGLMSRPSAGMCPLSQVRSVCVSRTAANIRFCRIACVESAHARALIRMFTSYSCPGLSVLIRKLPITADRNSLMSRRQPFLPTPPTRPRTRQCPRRSGQQA